MRSPVDVRDHSVLSGNTGTRIYSLPFSSCAGMHSLTGVDMMENVKHKNINQKGLYTCHYKLFKSQHLILFCPFQTQTIGKSLKNSCWAKSKLHIQPTLWQPACLCSLLTFCYVICSSGTGPIFWKTSLDPSSSMLSLAHQLASKEWDERLPHFVKKHDPFFVPITRQQHYWKCLYSKRFIMCTSPTFIRVTGISLNQSE